MANQIVPNTEIPSVAIHAVAWEITRMSVNASEYTSLDAWRVAMTNKYIEVFQAIYNQKPIQADKQGK
jgi:hypothetical protein